MVFLYILVIHSSFVGMSLGVLLPTMFPGVCFGGALTVFCGSIFEIQSAYYVPVAGAVLSLASVALSARYANPTVDSSVINVTTHILQMELERCADLCYHS